MKFDVCIIGAGPAGLSAAHYLIRRGAKVALVEKQTILGEKCCGGGITTAGLPLVASLTHPNFSWQREAHFKLSVYAGNKSTHIELADSFMTVTRRAQWQQSAMNLLRDLGMHVFWGARVRQVFAHSILLTDQKRITADYIIAADGAKSRVRSSLGLPSAVGATCRQLVIVHSHLDGIGFDSTVPSVWFDYGKFGASYGWAFPFEDELRIGCGVPAATGNNRKLKQSFFSWLQTLRVPVQKGRLETGSIGCNYVGHRFGHVFLAGDAAGMASSVTGEGIWQALVSGEEVAKEIVLKDYRSRVIPALATRHQRTYNALMHPVLGPLLYKNTASLLKLRPLAHAALARYS